MDLSFSYKEHLSPEAFAGFLNGVKKYNLSRFEQAITSLNLVHNTIPEEDKFQRALISHWINKINFTRGDYDQSQKGSVEILNYLKEALTNGESD